MAPARAMIGVENPDSTITAVCLHQAGSLEGAERWLLTHWSTPARVARQMAFGDRARPEDEQAEAHALTVEPRYWRYDQDLDPAPDTSALDPAPTIYPDLAAYLVDGSLRRGAGTAYLYTGGAWLVFPACLAPGYYVCRPGRRTG